MPRKVLLVDDSEVALDVIQNDLEANGFSVQVAHSTIEAVKLVLGGVPPDLILLDLMMPGMEGDKFCALLKQRVETRKIPVVFLSTKEEAELERVTHRAGAEGWLNKGKLTSDDLLKKVREFLP